MDLFLLAAWAVCVCLSFIGYGKAVARLCGLTDQPWALAGSLGISLILAVGGLLEITGQVKKPVLVAIVLGGDLLFVVRAWRDRTRRPLGLDRMETALLVLLAALCAARLVGNLQPQYFHVNDDLGGYLSFPTQMLQLGALPSDPFSERRVTSGLGGSYFLQTFTMVAGDSRSVRFIDWGFGYVLYAGLIFALGRRLTLSRKAALLLALLTFVIPLRRTNVTMVVLPAALVCALFWLQLLPRQEQVRAWVRPLLMGLIAAAVCTLKATDLPAAVLICALYYLAECVRTRSASPVREGALWAGAALVCLLPWMLDLKLKEGTYLFPLLGKGYEASAYGTVPLPGKGAIADLSIWSGILPLVAPFGLAIAAALVAWRRRLRPNPVPAVSLFLAVAISAVAVALATHGESMARYTLPFLAPGMIVFTGYSAVWAKLRPRPLWATIAALCCAVWIGGLVLRYGVQNRIYREYLMDIGYRPPSNDVIAFDPRVEGRRVAAIQASVPPGEPILEHLLVSYSFNFKRNPVYIADFPGLAGLPPGMPIGEGAQSLRQYLLSHSIRYVAFTYGRGRFVDLSPEVSLRQLIANPAAGGRHTWLYVQNKAALDVQHNWNELAKEQTHVYDDGEACVLDLKSRRG